MYLVDVDDGDNLDRFLADDPLQALSGVLPKNGRADSQDFTPCVVRVERLRQEGDGAKGKKVS